MKSEFHWFDPLDCRGIVDDHFFPMGQRRNGQRSHIEKTSPRNAGNKVFTAFPAIVTLKLFVDSWHPTKSLDLQNRTTKSPLRNFPALRSSLHFFLLIYLLIVPEDEANPDNSSKDDKLDKNWSGMNSWGETSNLNWSCSNQIVSSSWKTYKGDLSLSSYKQDRWHCSNRMPLYRLLILFYWRLVLKTQFHIFTYN